MDRPLAALPRRDLGRSAAWKPETWDPDALPRRARIVKAVEAPEVPLEELDRHYGPRYAEKLYG